MSGSGSIVKRVGKSGKISYAAVWRAGGRQRWRTFSRHRDAAAHLAKVVTQIHEGRYVELRPAPLHTVLDRWLVDWLDVQVKLGKPRASTARAYRAIVNTRLRALGDIRSDQLSRQHIARWLAPMAEQIAAGTLAPKTLGNAFALLTSILKWGRLEHYLTHDPLVGFTAPPKTRVEREFLQPEEIRRLLAVAAAHPPMDTILKVALYSGLRRGEIFSLHWSDIDWGGRGQGGRLLVRHNRDRGTVTTSPKTTAGRRTVDVPQFLLDDLAVYKAMYPPLAGDLIFRSHTGSPVHMDHWCQDRFRPLLDEAGLRALGFHSLRHTYASLLVSQGENLKYV
jgi:integrase